MKNNWVSAISEDEATGETAEIFCDIRTTLGNGVVNLIWRHIATIEGALPLGLESGEATLYLGYPQK